MSGVAIIQRLLQQHEPLLALLPAEKIRIGVIPQNFVLPAIGITSVSQNEVGTVARNNKTRMIRERVQVTVLARYEESGNSYGKLKRIIQAAALGRGVHTGVVAGINVRSVLPMGVGPDILPADDGIYEQSRDFMVTFIEAN